MKIEIERRQMSLYLKDSRGLDRRQVFAEMDDSTALQLIREYGYDPKRVYAIEHETVRYQHEVDDSMVRSVLERMPSKECYSLEEMLWAVRCIVPQAVGIAGRMPASVSSMISKEKSHE